MKVLVTGIDGFVGSHLAEFLLGQADIEIHGLVFDPRVTPNIDHLKPFLSFHQCDITDQIAVRSLIGEIAPDRIIHLAGQAFVPASFEHPMETFNTNIWGGLSVLEGVRRNSTSAAVVIVGTGEIYGRVDPERQPIKESFPIAPNNPYAASKASLDLLTQQYRRSFGVRAIMARPFNHAGPRQNPIFVCSDFGKQFAEIALKKSPRTIHVGNLEARRDFTDVRDVVKAYWAMFDAKGDEGVYNVCSGQAVQIRDIIMMLQEISGLDLAITTEEKRRRPYEVPLVVGSFEKLASETGWQPSIPLRRTLQDVFEYWCHEVSRQG